MDNIEKKRFEIIKRYFNDIKIALDVMPVDSIIRVAETLEEARSYRKPVYIFGNGGSAATASHCACDFAKGASCSGKPRIKAMALNDNVPLLSAWANDESYEQVYAQQLENFIEEGDIAIGISVSGNSPNVLNGIKVARSKGATTIGFTCAQGGRLKDLVDIAVRVPLNNMEQVEDLHLLLEHVITTCLRTDSIELAYVGESRESVQ